MSKWHYCSRLGTREVTCLLYNFHSRKSLGTFISEGFLLLPLGIQKIFIMQIIHDDIFCYQMLVFIKAIIHCVFNKSSEKGMGWFQRDLRTCHFSFIRPPLWDLPYPVPSLIKNNCLQEWETCEMLVMWHELLIVPHWHRCANLCYW